MKLKYCILLLLAFATLGIYAQEIKGTVYQKEDGSTMQGVKVKVYEKGKLTDEISTNDKGQFSLFLLSDTTEYTIVFRKSGYVAEKTKVRGLKPGANFDVLLRLNRKLLIEGKVKNKTTNEGIEGAEININNNKTNEVVKITTDKDGVYSFRVDPMKDYSILSSKPYLMSKRMSVVECDTSLRPRPKLCFSGFSNVRFEEREGDLEERVYTEMELEVASINKIINLGDIPYEYGNEELSNKGEAILNKAAQILKDNKGIIVELGAHTDSRGSYDFNLSLSEVRAEDAKDYIIDKGIPDYRVQDRGYGELYPLNHCVDGIDCSEQEHLVNRRAELKIIGFKY